MLNEEERCDTFFLEKLTILQHILIIILLLDIGSLLFFVNIFLFFLFIRFDNLVE